VAEVPSQIDTVKSGVSGRVKAVRNRPGIAHILRGYAHYKDHRGDHLAAAITYFSFLALFPLILLGISVTGFVLSADRALRDRLTASIASNAGGALGDTLNQIVNTAISNRGGVGAIGLVGVLLAGLGWIGNLRAAIDAVWGVKSAKRSFVTAKLADALVLAGLGLAVVVSVALTAGGTAATGTVLRWIGAERVAGISVLARLIGLGVAVLGDFVVLGWLIVRLPHVEVSRRVTVRTALVAAVGFEVLKLVGTVYIARAAKSTTYGPLASVVGVLIWMDLVSRYLMYCVAWSATADPATSEARAAEIDGGAHERAVARAGVGPAAAGVGPSAAGVGPAATGVGAAGVGPVAVAAGLLSAGAAIGGAGVASFVRARRRARSQQARR
jgi:membrane protein